MKYINRILFIPITLIYFILVAIGIVVVGTATMIQFPIHWIVKGEVLKEYDSIFILFIERFVMNHTLEDLYIYFKSKNWL